MQDFKRARSDVTFLLGLYSLAVGLVCFLTFLWV